MLSSLLIRSRQGLKLLVIKTQGAQQGAFFLNKELDKELKTTDKELKTAHSNATFMRAAAAPALGARAWSGRVRVRRRQQAWPHQARPTREGGDWRVATDDAA